MPHARRVALLVLAAAMSLTAACRENEQNRPLDFRPHVYRGEKLPSLDERQKRELQERGNLQR